MGNGHMVTEEDTQHCQDDSAPQAELQIQRKPYQNPTQRFLCRNWPTESGIPMKLQGTQNTQNNPEQEEQSQKTHTFQFQNLPQGNTYKTVVLAQGLTYRSTE